MRREAQTQPAHHRRRRPHRAPGGDPHRHGPRADLQMRLHQTLARRGDVERELPAPLGLVLGTRLILAVAIEASWEVVENTDWLINRYRGQTVALDYYGDSVINSVADT